MGIGLLFTVYCEWERKWSGFVRESLSVRPTKHKHSKKAECRPADGEPKIARVISRKMKLSEDVLAGAPIITGYGRGRCNIENYRNIIEYTENVIRVQTKVGKIQVTGKNLMIAYYRDDSMCIIGDICGIEYH